MFMRWKMFATLLALTVLQGGAAGAETDNPEGYRLSDPVVHGNLAIYFVHGRSRSGPVPLTLQEALARKTIEVRETEQVNELQIENTGDEEIFIQAGDIVKGGKQDRVLSVSLVLPPHSGIVPIPSFCVEHGRWSARAGEDVQRFSSANAVLPSREAKIKMVRPAPLPTNGASVAEIGTRQQEIWNSVARIQGKLTTNLGASVAAPRSQTSLQLSLENRRLEREQAEYLAALQPRGDQDDDILGYVFAINGKVNSADIYPSNALFRKMWPKLLRASITEAIGERDAAAAPAPPTGDVSGFIASADKARKVETRAATKLGRVRTRESAGVLFRESRPAAAPAQSWIHRNYLAQ